MRIEIRKSGDLWRADCKELPGTPPVGIGPTEAEAVACLFYRVHFETTGGPDGRNWMVFIKPGECVVTTFRELEPSDAE